MVELQPLTQNSSNSHCRLLVFYISYLNFLNRLSRMFIYLVSFWFLPLQLPTEILPALILCTWRFYSIIPCFNVTIIFLALYIQSHDYEIRFTLNCWKVYEGIINKLLGRPVMLVMKVMLMQLLKLNTFILN